MHRDEKNNALAPAASGGSDIRPDRRDRRRRHDVVARGTGIIVYWLRDGPRYTTRAASIRLAACTIVASLGQLAGLGYHRPPIALRASVNRLEMVDRRH